MSVSPLSPSLSFPTRNSDSALTRSFPENSSKLEVNLQLSILINQYSGDHSLLHNPVDNVLNLVYQAAIDEINSQLENELGPDALQKAYASGLDVSPEATANRIVSISLGFFAVFQGSNPDEQGLQQAEHFIAVLRKGVDQGFAEAREILEALQVLDGDIGADIDRTYDLVQEGYDDFLEKFSASN